MLDFFHRLFSSDGFMPHGHCYLWRPGILWLHLISDALVALAYTSIPFTLLYLVRKRKDTPFNWMFLCFGTFIIACGATHVMEIWTLWTPTYWLAGMIKAVTAIASVATSILLIRLVPQALAIPTAAQLSRAHADLRVAHEELETRVRERTAELTRKNEELAVEIAERKRVEEALRVSESRFRRLGESGIMGIVLADVGGKVREANDAYLALVGYTRAELEAGKIDTAVVSAPAWQHARDLAMRELETRGSTQPFETEIIRKDGSSAPVLVGVTMLEAPQCLAVILDLTEQKRAEAAIRALRRQHEDDAKFRALLEAAPEAMVIVDRTDQVVLMNAQAERLFGYSREELLGKSVHTLLPDRPLGANVLGRRKDGSEFSVEISLSPLDTKDGPLVSSTIRDITARKQAEQDLRHAKDTAETASRELEAFSYSVAHDLRAPLRGINGYSAALLEDLGDKLDVESKRHLERIGAGAVRMGESIDALLRLSRVSRAEVVHVRVDITRLASEIVAQLRATSSAPVEVTIADGLTAEGDPPLVRQLLENLLENAWKFSAKRTPARIEVGRDSDGFYVRDNGAGFEMAYAQKLFSPFQRLHSATEFAGTGIGLATVQRIVQRHNGRVWAEAAVDKGATFHFTLG